LYNIVFKKKTKRNPKNNNNRICKFNLISSLCNNKCVYYKTNFYNKQKIHTKTQAKMRERERVREPKCFFFVFYFTLQIEFIFFNFNFQNYLILTMKTIFYFLKYNFLCLFFVSSLFCWIKKKQKRVYFVFCYAFLLFFFS
jgi:hypothetical protein